MLRLHKNPKFGETMRQLNLRSSLATDNQINSLTSLLPLCIMLLVADADLAGNDGWPGSLVG